MQIRERARDFATNAGASSSLCRARDRCLSEVPGWTDDFWTWRELMYRSLDRLTLETVGTVAAYDGMEMLESGFTRLGEFHYVQCVHRCRRRVAAARTEATPYQARQQSQALGAASRGLSPGPAADWTPLGLAARARIADRHGRGMLRLAV